MEIAKIKINFQKIFTTLSKIWKTHFWSHIIMLMLVFIITFMAIFSITTLMGGTFSLLEFLITSLITLIFLNILFFKLTIKLGDSLILLDNLHSTVSDDFKEIKGEAIIEYIRSLLRRINKTIEEISRENGTELTKNEIITLSEICFSRNSNIYTGIDSTIPSEFQKRYPNYLACHEDHLKNNPKNQGLEARYLIVNGQTLREDSINHPNEYNEFLKWHEQNDVGLYVVNPTKVDEILNENHLPSRNVAIWEDNFVLFFLPNENGDKERVWLKSIKRNKDAYNYTIDYLNKIKPPVAVPIRKIPSIFNPSLAERWGDYVNCNERIKREGPFLLEHLTGLEKRRIFDAASGIGCESIFLRKHNFIDITSNEIEDILASKADIAAESEGIPKLARKNLDWRKLTEEYRTGVFCAILLLGNSLCLINDKEDRNTCIEQFYKILQTGGKIIIDERNFDYMLKNKKIIEENPVPTFSSGGCMYCGTLIKGVPTEISDNKVTFICYENRNVTRKSEASHHELGRFELYPFKKGELKKLLENAGFIIEHVYSDLKDEIREDAEFFTYIAKKP